ncbi:MAG: hypothetical protein DMG39_26865 [Acidobacteria bacterium]|nr:MAG: hypothetical protein DMG39_26865 [Acidobacteriota bacterium]
MTRKVRKLLSLYFATVAMPLGIATAFGLARRPRVPRATDGVSAEQQTDGAYRDGLFLGKLDGRQGREKQSAVGRWNSDRDRASFLAGYEKGYREAVAARNAERR